MTKYIRHRNKCRYALVETPRWGDVEFIGKWLIAAGEASRLWREASNDRGFYHQVEALETIYIVDLAWQALAHVTELRPQRASFTINLDDEDIVTGDQFAMLVEIGFFVRVGRRYKMAIPGDLSIDKVKKAALRFARTDSDSGLHPEYLVHTMTFKEVTALQKRLGEAQQSSE